MTIKPTNQMSKVRDTSQMLRAKALMYFVTETEHTLKIVMENTPKMANDKSRADDPIDVKYVIVCSM